MLSYRHSYHAGNFADVLKHLCLIECLDYLTSKGKPLCYIDTHSGCAAFQLNSEQAQKTAEFKAGIGQLWQQSDLPEALQNYVSLVKIFNPTCDLEAYPGSPWFAQQALQPSDRLFLCELHPNEVDLLRQNMRGDRRVKVRFEEGLQALVSFMPPKEKRALVLIDPSYEVKTEYKEVIKAVKAAHRRLANGTYLIWYPVVMRSRIDEMEQELIDSGIRNIQLFELGIKPDEEEGMTASGLLIINPPWNLKAKLEQNLPYLANHLSQKGNGFYRSEVLVAE